MKEFVELKNKFKILNRCSSEIGVKNKEILKTIKKYKNEINEMEKEINMNK